MSGELIDLLAILPRSCQEMAIIFCLNNLLASGEYCEANKIVDGLKQIHGNENLKAEALCLGVILAVRTRDNKLALDRYRDLACSYHGDNGGIFAAKALFHLTDIMLPDHPSKLARLWHDILPAQLSGDSQRICAKIGVMLIKQFRKNNDAINRKKTVDTMRKYLSEKDCKAEFEKISGYIK